MQYNENDKVLWLNPEKVWVPVTYISPEPAQEGEDDTYHCIQTEDGIVVYGVRDFDLHPIEDPNADEEESFQELLSRLKAHASGMERDKYHGAVVDEVAKLSDDIQKGLDALSEKISIMFGALSQMVIDLEKEVEDLKKEKGSES